MVVRGNERYNKSMTIVLDNLPPNVTEALAKQAQLEGKSLQDVTAEAVVRSVAATPPKWDLSQYIGSMTEEGAQAIEEVVRWRENGGENGGGPVRVELTGPPKRDLSDIAGTWVDDPEFDEAMKDFERIDPE